MSSSPAAAPARLRDRRRMVTGPLPSSTVVSLHGLKTHDGADVPGTLFTVPGATTVATLMHPRSDVTRHYLVSILLDAGIAVWAQGTRTVGTDLTLVHEEAVGDLAAGLSFLAERGFEEVVTLGVSGGGPLVALYLQQARRAADRIALTPSGRPTGLPELDMPLPTRVVFVAAHAGPGEMLLRCIDPAVADESDPNVSVPSLDMYDPANGFEPPPNPTTYTPEFLDAYRRGQRARVERLDARARTLLERRQAAKRRARETDDQADVRGGLVTEVLTVYRTDADPRFVDLSLDPSDRPYGSVYGRRPDISNYGLTGFGRLSTPDAWLSTWSALSSNASFIGCAGEITAPTLFIEYTGDQIAMPADSARMFDALAAKDKTHLRVPGTHFGGAVAAAAQPGGALAGASIADWVTSAA